MKTQEITDRLHDLQNRATKTFRDVGESTDRYVRDNTWTTVACAALVGCIVGFLLSGRRD